MNEKILPAYDELEVALNKTTLKLHPSQAHGVICGILCGNSKASTRWEQLVTGGKKNAKTHEILQVLYKVSKKQLEEFLFEFQLVAPLETEELQARAEALTLWAQGFLTGLKAAQVQIIGREPSETTEAIQDLIEIAKMNYEEVVASEEDEAAYIELIEYVRMAAILIYQDMHDQISNVSKRLH